MSTAIFSIWRINVLMRNHCRSTCFRNNGSNIIILCIISIMKKSFGWKRGEYTLPFFGRKPGRKASLPVFSRMEFRLKRENLHWICRLKGSKINWTSLQRENFSTPFVSPTFSPFWKNLPCNLHFWNIPKLPGKSVENEEITYWGISQKNIVF